MPDDEARQLERDAAHGDLATRARALTQRVREADLSPDRLRVAAALGDPASRIAAGEDPAAEDTLTLREWVEGLWEIEAEAGVRAALTLARIVSKLAAESSAAVIPVIEDWLVCPSPELEAKARAGANTCEINAETAAIDGRIRRAHADAALSAAARCVVETSDPAATRESFGLIQGAYVLTPHLDEPPQRTGAYQAGRAAIEVCAVMNKDDEPDVRPLLRSVVSAALIGWALG